MFKVIKNTKLWFTISIVLAIASIASLSIFGLKLGIDYKGGTEIQFKSADVNRMDIAKSTLDGLSYSGYQIKESGQDQSIIRLQYLTNEDHAKFVETIKLKLPDYTETQYDTVGPVIGTELMTKSLWAVVLATLGIIIFVAFAFRRVPKPLSSWKFGVCAVVALLHDLLIVAGFVSIMGHFFVWMQADALFVTALLTIMGFSVHDTIVVYDRLRENFIKHPHDDIATVAENSITQTMVRSINTSMTTVIVLLSLLIFGSDSIKHFIAILVFGIIIGTYSSIFNAAPLLVVWQKNSMKKRI
jgi:preprotein translocase subunit SecF